MFNNRFAPTPTIIKRSHEIECESDTEEVEEFVDECPFFSLDLIPAHFKDRIAKNGEESRNGKEGGIDSSKKKLTHKP